MKLNRLISEASGISLKTESIPSLEITGLAYDSREVEQGNLFIAINGFQHDGHRFIKQAVHRGAVAILSEIPVKLIMDGKTVPVLVNGEKSNRQALSSLSAVFYRNPWNELLCIGVTGTNGKTSTAHMLGWILEKTGRRTGILGTVGHIVAGKSISASVTTPESIDIARLMRSMVDGGDAACVMEVSSHALALSRADCVRYDCCIFTNITQDHLDFHRDMDEYLGTKLHIFDLLKPAGKKVTGRYSPGIPAIPDAASFGFEETCTYTMKDIRVSLSGSQFFLTGPSGTASVTLSIPGKFNVYNAAGALAGLSEIGMDIQTSAEVLREFRGVPGRFETVNLGQKFLVAVDYAHTPDALRRILEQARELTEHGKVIVVFGCGGDRDRKKRPVMGEIVQSIADISVVTSDNPRTEDPDEIIHEILTGMNNRKNVIVEPDRGIAINTAIMMAEDVDTVIIAGKGHEDYQILGRKRIHFDDREEAQKSLEEKLAQKSC